MRILSNRVPTFVVSGLAVLLTIGLASASSASELDDIVARIDYGFYTADPRMIQAARDELARSGSDDAEHAYYEAYAAYRMSRLDRTARPRERRALIRDCLETGRASARTEDWSAEAWILVAACSIQGIAQEPSRSLGHESRLNQALTAAREIDADNPRLLLVESWYVQDGEGGQDVRERRRVLLERAREQFDARENDAGPDWGRAELLASLGKIYLDLGERRAARDLIEQALIEAPEYYFALELRKALSL